MRRTFYAVTALMAMWGTGILLNVGGLLCTTMPEPIVLALLLTFAGFSATCTLTAIHAEG